ncbi:Zinc finger BED domain-containing protein RICESLEEPER 1 [Linum grandiflorum]
MEPEPIENAPVQNNNEEQPLSPPGNPENQPQDAIAQPPLAASSNLTSDVWPHFTRLYLNGILKAKCIYCKKVLAGKSTNGTSHLRTHRNRCVQKKIHYGSQRILGANYSAKGKAEMSTNQFSNFFPKVCELRLRLLEWLGDPNPMIVSMAGKMWNKFAKYWDDIHLLLVVTVVLDPRYKLDLVEYYAARFGIDSTDLVAERVKSVVADLVMEYQRKSPKNTSVSLTCAPSSSSTDLDFDRYVRQRKKVVPNITTELDHYLAEDVHPRTEDFDLLGWWKFSGAKYPILQDI